MITFTLLRACLGVADWYAPGGRLPPETIVDQVTDQVLFGVLRSNTGLWTPATGRPRQVYHAHRWCSSE